MSVCVCVWHFDIIAENRELLLLLSETYRHVTVKVPEDCIHVSGDAVGSLPTLTC